MTNGDDRKTPQGPGPPEAHSGRTRRGAQAGAAGQALRLRVQAKQPERYRQVRPLPRAGNQDGEAWKGAIRLILKIFVVNLKKWFKRLGVKTVIPKTLESCRLLSAGYPAELSQAFTGWQRHVFFFAWGRGRREG